MKQRVVEGFITNIHGSESSASYLNLAVHRGLTFFLLYGVSMNLTQQALSKDKQFTFYNVSSAFTAESSWNSYC